MPNVCCPGKPWRNQRIWQGTQALFLLPTHGLWSKEQLSLFLLHLIYIGAPSATLFLVPCIINLVGEQISSNTRQFNVRAVIKFWDWLWISLIFETGSILLIFFISNCWSWDAILVAAISCTILKWKSRVDCIPWSTCDPTSGDSSICSSWVHWIIEQFLI